MALYKPGQSGNPAGRPPGLTSYKHLIQKTFVDIMATKVKTGKGKNVRETTFYSAFLEGFMADALAGDYRARSFIAERLLEPGVLDSIDSYLNKGMREDIDFMRYRIKLLAHDVQTEYLLTKEKKIFQMAGRRAGKSDGHLLKAIDVMMTHPGAKILYVARTIGVGMDLMHNQFKHYCGLLGIGITHENRSEGQIVIENTSEFYIKGNATTAARENMRGAHYSLIIIDEAQSQDALSYLIQDICEPMLIDTNGTLVLSGTGPRIRGTFWEELYENRDKFKGKRMNWNLSQNPFIANYEKVLDDIKAEKNITDTTPLFVREYLGKISYDDDAMVLRFDDGNFYTESELAEWINQQPIDDIRFTAGLDYGYVDCDAFIIICYSKNKKFKEKFVVYEYKQNRTGITELADAIKKGIDKIKTHHLFSRMDHIPDETFVKPGVQFTDKSINKKFYIYCDTNEQKVSQELFSQFKLPVTNCYKYEKSMAIELLQEDVKNRLLKVPNKESYLYQESLKTLFKRNDKDEMTREIDDRYHHWDLGDAAIYSLRSIWKLLQ